MRECGLKFTELNYHNKMLRVTPLAGVWIEISRRTMYLRREKVTPLAGVWIEILKT